MDDRGTQWVTENTSTRHTQDTTTQRDDRGNRDTRDERSRQSQPTTGEHEMPRGTRNGMFQECQILVIFFYDL